VTNKVKMLLVVVFSVVATSSPTPAKVLPITAKLVPPETILLIDIADFGRLKTQFEKTSFYKLYKDPAMAAFLSDAKTKWQKQTQELPGNNILKAFLDAGVWPQGRISLALVLNEQTKDANEPPALFITQWGQNISRVKEAIKKLVEKNSELGGHKKTAIDYRGVHIETIVDEQATELSYCFIDDCLIGSFNLEVLKFVIAHITGAGSETLATNTDYTPSIKAVGPFHDIDFYVNIKQIIKTVISEDSSGEAQTTMSNSGLENIRSLSCSIGLARSPRINYWGKALLKIDGTKRGIIKMLEAESLPIRPPRFLPSSVCSVTFFNLDIRKAYDELVNILNSFSPQYASILYVPLLPPGADGEPPVQLKSGIIDHLGSQITVAQRIEKPFTKESVPTEYILALEVSDHTALEKTLSLVHSRLIAPNDPTARRELLGHTIYLVNPANLPFLRPTIQPMQTPKQARLKRRLSDSLQDTTGPEMPKVAFTITDTHLIIGFEPAVERAIRTLSDAETASLSTTKWFSDARQALPSVVGVASLEDNAASGELLWWLMKQRGQVKTSNLLPGPAGSFLFSSVNVGQLFDTKLLPEFDIVRKYFGLSASYGLSRPDGFFFEFKQLNTGTRQLATAPGGLSE